MCDYISLAAVGKLWALIFYEIDKKTEVRNCGKFPKKLLKERAFIEVRFEGKKVKGQILKLHGN